MRCIEGLVAVLVLAVTANAAEFKLTASDAAQADEFGYSVAVSGDVVVVGARFDDDLGQGSGSAYVYQRVGGQWVEQAKLTASDGAAFDFFGYAVAVDGDTIVVGAPQGGGDWGKAYVFQRSGSIWTEQAKLVADDPLRRVVGFGTAVAIVPDHIVVGAPYTEVSLQSTGSCYVFRRLGSAWQQEAALAPAVDVLQDRFGSSVAISGDLIGVGASEYLIGPGAAYTFRHDGMAWQQEAKLTSASVSVQAQLGAAIAVDDQTLVVGAPDDNHPSGAGSVLVFKRTGANWVEQPKLMASDTPSQAGFGSSVAVRGEDLAVVGGHSAYLFKKAGEAWVEEAKYFGDVPFGLGRTVDIDVVADVVTIVAGAPADNEAGPSSGSALVFEFGRGFFTLVPCRAVDTRSSPGGVLVAGEDRPVQLSGICGIPATAKSVSANLTVTQGTAAGDLRLYPIGTMLPSASVINYGAGQTRANNAVAPLGDGGAVGLHVDQGAGTIHLIFDVNGYFQ